MAAQRVDRRRHRLEADDGLIGRREDLRVAVAGRQLDRRRGARRRRPRTVAPGATANRSSYVRLAERERLGGELGRARRSAGRGRRARARVRGRQLDPPVLARRRRAAPGRGGSRTTAARRIVAGGDRRRRPSALRPRAGSPARARGGTGRRPAARGGRRSRARRSAMTAPRPSEAPVRRGGERAVDRQAVLVAVQQRRAAVELDASPARPRSPSRRAGSPTGTAAGSRTRRRGRGRRRGRRRFRAAPRRRWRSEQPTIPAPTAKRAVRSPSGATSSTTVLHRPCEQVCGRAPAAISSAWGDGRARRVEVRVPVWPRQPSPRAEPRPDGDEPRPADVFVVFGITGDLAKVMTFRSLYRLERRGLLDCPIVGVAVDDWTVDDLREHARAAIDGAGEPVDDEVFERFAARLSLRAGRLRRRRRPTSGVAAAIGGARHAGLLPRDPAVPVRHRGRGARRAPA